MSLLKPYNLTKKGLSVTFRISTSKISNTQSLSWITTSIALSDSIKTYSNNVYGLLGNNNGDPSDDISYRNGTIEYGGSDRTIYQAAVTCNHTFLFSCHFND
jgi:hypothetical protein